ncbi:MAG: hypothetical protein Aurels2KO_36170 [Aureliella sp.]
MAILDTLLISAAVPVAKEAASAAVETISAAGAGFAELLRGDATSAQSADNGGKFSIGDELLEGFRSWLQANGITGELDLDIAIEPGQPLSFSGKDASRIADHVAANPKWQGHFNRLAQQVSSAFGGTTQDPVTIKLSDSTWALSLGNSASNP